MSFKSQHLETEKLRGTDKESVDSEVCPECKCRAFQENPPSPESPECKLWAFRAAREYSRCRDPLTQALASMAHRWEQSQRAQPQLVW
jgi:hypothetical protein